jgi:hypothetical protein
VYARGKEAYKGSGKGNPAIGVTRQGRLIRGGKACLASRLIIKK